MFVCYLKIRHDKSNFADYVWLRRDKSAFADYVRLRRDKPDAISVIIGNERVYEN